MSEAYVGEIRCFGFNFAPYQWALCNGQTMAISQNQALFAILGTTYGGNGVTTFNLPNLQGQIPMHWGTQAGLPTTNIGEVQGTSSVALNIMQIPQHNHGIFAATPGAPVEKSPTPNNQSYFADAKGGFIYQNPPVTPNAPFSPRAISQTGTSLPHDNMQPYQTLNFCISLYGIFPSRG